MSLIEAYRSAYMRLGCRELVRPRHGYDAARQRDINGGPPTTPKVTEKARQLILKLEQLWKPSMADIVLKVSYFCGRVSPQHFLEMATNLMMCELMDYYTVDLWAEAVITEFGKDFQQPCCVACKAVGPGELMVCARCRQLVYCSPECQRIHWKSGHKGECKVLQKVYCSSTALEKSSASPGDAELLLEMFSLSMKLVEEAEHQLYEDDDGRKWLFLEEYKMPSFAKTDLLLNLKPKVLHPYLYLYQSVEYFRPRILPDSHKAVNYLDRWGLPFEIENVSNRKLSKEGYNIRLGDIASSGVFHDFDRRQMQFVDKLIERKKKLLEEKKLHPEDSPDFILRIEIMGTNPRVWRRFQCPSSVALFTLADKILAPVMGWVRNYHAYTFVDLTDGAHFGPTGSDAVDMCYVKFDFHKMIDDCDVQLGQVIGKKGDSMVWCYDLGDRWEHIIHLEKVVKPAGVMLHTGEMSCPAEDEKEGWQEEVLAKLPPRSKWAGACHSAISEGLKQKLHGFKETMANVKESGQYFSKDPCMYDPYHFDLRHHQNELKKALASNLRSTTGGSKKCHAEFKNGKFVRSFSDHTYRHSTGRASVTTEKGFVETVDLRRDSKELALCGNCGSRRDLAMCKSCKQIYYCGEACQRRHWHEGGHKEVCRRLRKVHKNYKKEEKEVKEGKPTEQFEDDVFATKAGKKEESRVSRLERNLAKVGAFYCEDLHRKFKAYSGLFTDEEISKLEKVDFVDSFLEAFVPMSIKYGKVVGDVGVELVDVFPKQTDIKDDKSTETADKGQSAEQVDKSTESAPRMSSTGDVGKVAEPTEKTLPTEELEKEDETEMKKSVKSKYKSKKNANKMKMRRKLL